MKMRFYIFPSVLVLIWTIRRKSAEWKWYVFGVYFNFNSEKEDRSEDGV